MSIKSTCAWLIIFRALFTGGTISGGSIYGALDDSQYGQLQITGEQIIARNPYLLNNTQLAVSNWTTVDSGSTGTNDALVMNMTRFAYDTLCSDDSDTDGAIFTHGTNSLEETAFLMDSLVNCGKPVVAVGSMRPWTTCLLMEMRTCLTVSCFLQVQHQGIEA